MRTKRIRDNVMLIPRRVYHTIERCKETAYAQEKVITDFEEQDTQGASRFTSTILSGTIISFCEIFGV